MVSPPTSPPLLTPSPSRQSPFPHWVCPELCVITGPGLGFCSPLWIQFGNMAAESPLVYQPSVDVWALVYLCGKVEFSCSACRPFPPSSPTEGLDPSGSRPGGCGRRPGFSPQSLGDVRGLGGLSPGAPCWLCAWCFVFCHTHVGLSAEFSLMPVPRVPPRVPIPSLSPAGPLCLSSHLQTLCCHTKVTLKIRDKK